MSADPRRLVIRGLARLERERGAVAQAVLRRLLDAPDARQLDPRDRGFVTECFYGVLRWRLRLDAEIGRRARKGMPSDPELANVLRLGAYQLLLLDRVPARAAIHTSVSITRRLRGDRVARFVNGVLRAIDRERTTPADLAERWAHPAWMVERLRAELGDDEQVEARLRANMTAPPTSLRLHPTARIEELPGARPSSLTPGVVLYEGPAEPVRQGVREGRWIAQDEASARVVHLLDCGVGQRVLELCAGRGVKSSHIATLIGESGLLVAVDSSAAKLADARRLVERWAPATPWLGLAADATRTLPLRPDLRFDRILVDAPCSGLGVIRRRPETLWRRRPEDVITLAALQRRIVDEALRWLTPGGALVYAVCTTTPEETTGVIGDRVVEATLETRPERDGADGFYAAKLSL